MKLGTKDKTGTMTVTVTAEKNVLYLHAAAWKDKKCTLGITTETSGVTLSPASWELTADDGITGSSPFTFSGDVTDAYFCKVKIDGNTAGATITLSSTSTSAGRCVVWGVNEDLEAAVNATAVALSETVLALEQYKYVTLTATPTPADATDDWAWASDNEAVATVTQNGKVTIVAATGTANITVTSKTTPTVTATCVITAKEATVITCAQAVEKAQAVSANNEIAAGGMYVIRGYVTEVATAYDDTYGNVSVWLADAADGGQVFEADRVVPVDDAAKAAGVGDFVEVVGDITKYNATYETSAGGSLKIITKATPTALVAPELSGIYANGGTIEGIGAAGRIFTVSGMEVTSQNGALTSGIYIVKLGDQTQKIAVK